MYRNIETKGRAGTGLQSIFESGFGEFSRLRQQGTPAELLLEGARRAMRVAQMRELDRLERNLAMLATVGSTSPYVGLFGTVWGIMSAFHNLGNVQQATLAAVAPGIAEALITTAIGPVRGDSRGDRLQPLRRSSEPPGASLRHLRRRVLHHPAAPRAGPRAGLTMPAPLRRRKLMGEINVVPYIDVMLVLLIIFMITAPLLKEGIKVDLPNAGAKPIDPDFLQKHEPLIVTIDARGRCTSILARIPTSPPPSRPSARAPPRCCAAIRRRRFWSRPTPPSPMARWCTPWCSCSARAPRRWGS